MPPPSASPALHLTLLPESFAVFQLPASQQPPTALMSALTDSTNSKFVSITRVSDEISVVCDYTILPNGTQSDEWKCIKIVGPMDLSLTGILSAMTAPLRVAKVPVFVVSTWNTDWLLVNSSKAVAAVNSLKADGWTFRG